MKTQSGIRRAEELADYILTNVRHARNRHSDDQLWVTDLGSARLLAQALIDLIDAQLK